MKESYIWGFFTIMLGILFFIPNVNIFINTLGFIYCSFLWFITTSNDEKGKYL